MKPIKIFSFILGIVLVTSSCTDDLNPKSLGSQAITSATLYKTPADYLQGLAKVYAGFNLQGSTGDTDITTALTGGDGGATVYSRQLWNWQELSTDEAVIAWQGNGDLLNIHLQNWTPTGGYITALYTRIMFTITLANEFIRVSSGSTDADIKQYNAEARFLRALAYWHALDLYGNPPFVTETDPIGAFNPKQTNQSDLFAYIESELSAIESQLGEPGFDYGRADKGALWMLQAKLYLNAETYIQAAKYTECLTALNKLISSGKYSLATNYLQNFRADNNTSPEIIFPLTQDGIFSQTYGGMTYVIHAAVGGNMSTSDYGIASAWAGTRTTSALVKKFADPSGATDKRAQFFTDGQTLEIQDYTVFGQGYTIKKFSNKTLAGGAAPSGAPDFVDTDFPMFRLADAYLMYAEAVLRGGDGGTRAQALTYINQVLTRAYGDNSGNIADNQLTLPFIIDERARELYWEGHRRTDLIRFGMFSETTYVWPWKGNVAEGASTPAYRNLLPIPASDLNSNPNLKQNTGY